MAVAVARPLQSGNGKHIDVEVTLRSFVRLIESGPLGNSSASWWTGLRTGRAAVDPGPHQFAQSLLRAGDRIAPGAWMPRPGDEIIFGQVIVQ